MRATRLIVTATVCTLIATMAPVGAADNTGPGSYTVEQAISDNAQLNTLAFDGLGFLTGTIGSDSFFPPGKVADFWGFQYLRDNDPSEMGHNTDFLTRAALFMLDVLTPAQRAELATLAKSQVIAINNYAMQRFTFMTATRRLLAHRLPKGTTGLNAASVARWSATQYRLDGTISIQRARVMGALLHDLTSEQRARLEPLRGTGMSTWPVVAEVPELRGLSGDEKVAVMTYAGDMFSWYMGDLTADVYFCPERHGTYFGSFYLKDAPAVGNPGYSIDTTITGNLGGAFLAALSPAHAKTIRALVPAQRAALTDIVQVRRAVAVELRKAMAGAAVSDTTVSTLMTRYGNDDGRISYLYAMAFASVGSTLSTTEKTKLAALRVQLVGAMAPTGAYRYATPIPLPKVASTDFLFRAPA